MNRGVNTRCLRHPEQLEAKVHFAPIASCSSQPHAGIETLTFRTAHNTPNLDIQLSAAKSVREEAKELAPFLRGLLGYQNCCFLGGKGELARSVHWDLRSKFPLLDRAATFNASRACFESHFRDLVAQIGEVSALASLKLAPWLVVISGMAEAMMAQCENCGAQERKLDLSDGNSTFRETRR